MEWLLFIGLCIFLLLLAILWYCIRIFDEIVYSRNMMLKMFNTTQSSIGMKRRSNPDPKIPHPKVEQRYEGQGAKRISTAGAVTASNTPVRIGSVKRRRVGGTTGDTSSS